MDMHMNTNIRKTLKKRYLISISIKNMGTFVICDQLNLYMSTK